MNIFYLSENPTLAAQAHSDQHIPKMVVETAQLLSTAHHAHNSVRADDVYRATHTNHPCSLWVRASSGNYDWTFGLLNALLDEYRIRFGRTHKTTERLGALAHNPVPRAPFTTPALAMPDQYKSEDPVAAYRAYYQAEKMNFARKGAASWARSPRGKPVWLN